MDPEIKHLRERPYEEFLQDPLGHKYRLLLEDQRKFAKIDHYSKRINFVDLESEIK